MTKRDSAAGEDTSRVTLAGLAATRVERPRSEDDGTIRSPEHSDEVGARAPTLPQATEDRYGEQAKIGAGGMGLVYRVRDQNLNRDVAMKVLRKDIKSDDLVSRFHVEAQIGGQLEHPGLLPVHDLSHDEEGNAFFTMRYVPGNETVASIIRRLRAGDQDAHETYTMERRVQLIQSVAHALSYAHQRGVIHRDVKPDNVLVGLKGEVYLVDWGIATLTEVDASQSSPESHGPGTTREHVETNIDERTIPEGAVVGTVRYMSPEQMFAEARLGPASDVYALCAVAYELFSLHHYLGDNSPRSLLAIIELVLHKELVDAESYVDPMNKRVPRQLSRILRWGLQKNRARAFASADELNEALQAWVEGRAPVVCPGTFIQRGLSRFSRAIDRRPVLLPAISLALAAGVLAAVVFTIVSLVTVAL